MKSEKLKKVILNFKKYCESISGTELIGHMGPNYGEWMSPNTISNSDTNLIYSDVNDKFYNEDDYHETYNQYLKKGGTPLQGGFSKKNIDTIIHFLNILKESSEYRYYPKEVGSSEFFDKYNKSKIENLNNSEIKQLSKNINTSYQVGGNIISIHSNRFTITIIKLEDEWFLIKHETLHDERYYICDGLEEVVSYIKLNT